MKSPHPADLHDARVLRRAVRWRAHKFQGRGAWERREDLPPAEALKLHQAGAGWLVYGIDAAGRAALVTDKLLALAAEPVREMA